MNTAFASLLVAVSPMQAMADGVAWNYDIAKTCAELVDYTDELGKLSASQAIERTDQVNELVELRLSNARTYNLSRIVLGWHAMDLLGDDVRGMRALEKAVLACVSGDSCDANTITKSANDLSNDLISACQKDFRGDPNAP